MKLFEFDESTFIERLKQDCQYYLSQSTGPLYRGIQMTSHYGITEVNLSRRNPSNTPIETHNEFNKWFNDHYGHPWRNSVFVTGDGVAAADYGQIYVIFPVGKFEFLWNPAIADLWSTTFEATHVINNNFLFKTMSDSEKLNKLISAYEYLFKKRPRPENTIEQLKYELQPMSILNHINSNTPYRNTDLNKAIDSGNEIMLWCNEYYYILNDVYENTSPSIMK